MKFIQSFVALGIRMRDKVQDDASMVRLNDMRNFAIGIVVLLLIAAGAYFYQSSQTNAPENLGANTEQAATTTPEAPVVKPQESIGTSVSGADITAYHFGTGAKKVLFVGGIHGGYEWNTVLLANQLIDHFKVTPSDIPANLTVTVIPVLNPDGLSKVLASTTSFTAFTVADVNKSQSVQVSGRYNGNAVDLNRNFDCDWKQKGLWQNKEVSGGAQAFSEPESKAVRDYIAANRPTAVVVWYSSAGGVYASNCHEGVLPETKILSDIYAKASGYTAHDSWDFYATTGDMVNWLAKEKIPAFSVLLTDHTNTEWDKNLAGVKAVLQNLAQ